MYLFTISVLLFSSIITKSTCYEEIPSRRINTETANSDDENCVCFPGGKSLIPELSNLKANGLERLVVYLYKNAYTNEVYVFQPSAEKQSLIPNIPYTSGDSLQPVTTETIFSLFSNYPNSPQAHQPVNTQGEPIGLNIGIVNHEAKPNGAFTGFPTRMDVNTQLPNKEYMIPSPSPHVGGYHSQQQLVYPPSKPSQYHQSTPSPFEHIGMEPNIIHPLIKPLQSFNFDESLVQTDVIADSNPGKDNWLFKEENYVYPLNPYQNKANVQSVKPQINYNTHESEVKLPKRISTFDDWYKEQIETVQNQKTPKGVNAIDSDGLRPLVLKTLYDNHIHIGAKGTMIDDTGTPIDLNNLELRPILIGSAVKFHALELNPQLTFPDTLPYLEGILILLIHPFKILGVIPVGKAYVSSPGKSNNPSFKYAYKNSNQIGSKTNSKLNYQSLDGQIPHFKASPNTGSAQKRFDYSSLGNDNPHLTVFPLKNKVASQFDFNTNTPNIIASSINSHFGSNSFWHGFYPADQKNPLLKPDFSSSNLIATPINGITESSFKSDGSNSNLVVRPLNKVIGPRPTLDSSSWSSFSNSGWGHNNGYPSEEPLPQQQSSWISEWGDAIIKSIPSVLNTEATDIKISNWNNLDESQNQPLVEGDTSIGPTRRFSTPVLKGVLKTLIQMVIENLVNEKNQKGEQQKEHDESKTSEIKDNDTVGNPNALKLAGNEDDDGPDYRIIGGSAATGSGSPLSNKGRSGLSVI